MGRTGSRGWHGRYAHGRTGLSPAALPNVGAPRLLSHTSGARKGVMSWPTPVFGRSINGTRRCRGSWSCASRVCSRTWLRDRHGCRVREAVVSERCLALCQAKSDMELAAFGDGEALKGVLSVGVPCSSGRTQTWPAMLRPPRASARACFLLSTPNMMLSSTRRLPFASGYARALMEHASRCPSALWHGLSCLRILRTSFVRSTPCASPASLLALLSEWMDGCLDWHARADGFRQEAAINASY